MTAYPGLFITLEGGEGSGKTTQIGNLKAALEAKSRTVVTTREPGGTPEAEKIRTLLVDRDGGAWTPMAECLLFYAARAMHVETLIKPALQAGKTVICDRFSDSTRAYQGYGYARIDPAEIETLDRYVLKGFQPDLTFILDLPVEAGLKRAASRAGREDRFERLDTGFHERMRDGYLTIAKDNPDRCVVIDAAQPPEKVTETILAHIKA